jgi:hypothetical protein
MIFSGQSKSQDGNRLKALKYLQSKVPEIRTNVFFRSGILPRTGKMVDSL